MSKVKKFFLLCMVLASCNPIISQYGGGREFDFFEMYDGNCIPDSLGLC